MVHVNSAKSNLNELVDRVVTRRERIEIIGASGGSAVLISKAEYRQLVDQILTAEAKAIVADPAYRQEIRDVQEQLESMRGSIDADSGN